ncbi:zinc-dependent metalloprotease [Arthrobacter sp. JSM 101049]|uniref:zinc-dependent metalloprotease n=1 Tax=Arthrobacter sp. JSM 101049 TaxID=929097 RepID=UPI0035639EE0
MGRMQTPATNTQLINWDVAGGTAARLVGPGPKLTAGQIGVVVEDLRAKADASVEHVHRITGLEAARDLRDSTVLVVDRGTWARANVQSFQALLAPAIQKLVAAQSGKMSPAAVAVGGGAAGVELGGILAFLSSKVLGQYDPFAGLGEGPSGGRLLIVAPNIVEIERELHVDPADFRLWVCLHEQTHRVQFAAAPWLRGHLQETIAQMTGGLLDAEGGLAERLKSAAQGAMSAIGRGRRDQGTTPEPGSGAPSSTGLLSVLQDPEGQALLSHLTAVMSLLEGHANVVMDAVDASIVPTVKTIRQRFNARGGNRGPVETWIRRFLGLEAKMRQYRDGQRFVDAVVRAIGMDGFNAVWERVENLPTEHEIHHPREWIDRVAGQPAS